MVDATQDAMVELQGSVQKRAIMLNIFFWSFIITASSSCFLCICGICSESCRECERCCQDVCYEVGDMERLYKACN